jgi:hypothetical protein
MIRRVELLALVKHDCPVCDQLLPALDAAGVRVLSQSSEADTAEQAQRVGVERVPEVDAALAVSLRFDPDAVPAVILLDGETERGRVEGIQRDRLRELAAAAGTPLALDGLPAFRPGCASRTREPWAEALIARREGRIRSRAIELGGLEDVFEALHARGVTDGLPVVPPTPERVVAMLEHTSRSPQDVVGVIPPYGGEATVEKVAVNAVMAGCPGEALPVVCAAVEAACRPEFAWHGLIATTHPAGPTVVVSGPYAESIGMNAAGNALGQGNRANLTIGRALQLVGRNLGGGRPGVEDRAAHGWAGKVGSCFAERLHDMPWAPLGDPASGETAVTVVATEAPRLVVDQLARDPESLAVSFAQGLQSVAHPKLVLAFDALLVVGPEHGRVFREAGWDRVRLRDALFELTKRPAGELVRGANGSAEGIEAQWVTDPEAPVQKFAAPDRILITYAGGDAGLFSMVYGTWASGEIGSAPQTARVEDWR